MHHFQTLFPHRLVIYTTPMNHTHEPGQAGGWVEMRLGVGASSVCYLSLTLLCTHVIDSCLSLAFHDGCENYERTVVVKGSQLKVLIASYDHRFL
jgi:hypothetical protein